MISDGTQTASGRLSAPAAFESDVISDGTQTCPRPPRYTA